MQSRQHSILLDGTTSACIRTQRVLDADLLLDNALLDEVLVDRVAEGNDTISQAVWVVLRLQLHLLLLMHLDGMQTILVEVRRLVRQLCLQLLLLQLLLLILILFDRWKIEILVFARKAIVVVPLFTIDHELKLRELFSRW